MYKTVAEIVTAAEERELPIWRLILEQEMDYTQESQTVVWRKMRNQLNVMKEAVERGTKGEGVFSPTGLTGGEAVKMKKYREAGKGLSGDLMLWAMENAIATNEVNASMGVICATPTAGSSGTLPGVLFAIDKKLNLTEEQMIEFLFTASAFGMVTANNAMIAGATGGCQAEVGSASAMAAAAAVELNGGTPTQAAEAFAMAMSNLLGLVCDPVAGLVELPCVKRNVVGAVNALAAADMALAGLENKIPADEVIQAMKEIGQGMPASLRETGQGGLAATPTGIRMRMKIFGESINLNQNED
ncbi:L-serine ammonia-lyase, iron-sulfur-dependent, subunit alpha [Ligilactobacillus ceti]|uniref:L-serine dehydratase n=1 Tax=Ligilactobacillus ceti DSM 22408 TaxID=1122146 RepID=A0A0R2KLP8_9LACO|nr:L-serine ammonia-lyase, iron-sulfur-dependent, subunit alpha [Ligilactobacillus ceti]KRN90339.1 L-serine dehydratase, alpha subunit [Ligilactobacillus ceti DSM 22408]